MRRHDRLEEIINAYRDVQRIILRIDNFNGSSISDAFLMEVWKITKRLHSIMRCITLNPTAAVGILVVMTSTWSRMSEGKCSRSTWCHTYNSRGAKRRQDNDRKETSPIAFGRFEDAPIESQVRVLNRHDRRRPKVSAHEEDYSLKL